MSLFDTSVNFFEYHVKQSTEPTQVRKPILKILRRGEAFVVGLNNVIFYLLFGKNYDYQSRVNNPSQQLRHNLVADMEGTEIAAVLEKGATSVRLVVRDDQLVFEFEAYTAGEEGEKGTIQILQSIAISESDSKHHDALEEIAKELLNFIFEYLKYLQSRPNEYRNIKENILYDHLVFYFLSMCLLGKASKVPLFVINTLSLGKGISMELVLANAGSSSVVNADVIAKYRQFTIGSNIITQNQAFARASSSGEENLRITLYGPLGLSFPHAARINARPVFIRNSSDVAITKVDFSGLAEC